MRLIVNGEDTETETDITLEELVDKLLKSTSRKGIAVAVNETMVPRDSWGKRRLQGGDRVEIIRPLQGG